MPTSKPAVPAAAEPRFADRYDEWHSISTGHQRGESKLPIVTGWRQSRSTKLSHQFKNWDSGGTRCSDLAGEGSDSWNEKAKALIPTYDIESAQCSVGNILSGEGKGQPLKETERSIDGKRGNGSDDKETPGRRKGIFDGLVIFLNGSTYPLISDHKLKQLLVENGARMSIHLGRRQVTHVILGKPSGPQHVGAGGGLAGSKIEKEIRRVGGCGVKYVGVEWVLESLKAGRRQAEAPYVNLKIAPNGQRSVYNMFKKISGLEPAVAE